MMRFLQLGASLYVPATRPDLAALGNGEKFPKLRSVIFCTEDAIREEELPAALGNLENALRRFEPVPLLRFIRPRTPSVLRSLLRFDHIDRVAGFVLPKVTRHNLDEYCSLFAPQDPFQIMPTLETLHTFDPLEMAELRNLLVQDCYRRRVLSLRVGGNDLFHLLGLRRPRSRTVYATPLGPLLSQLVLTFRPHGFNLSGPVFEYLDRADVLAREARRDLAYGLFGKSAIHPDQVPLIEAQYRVRPRELQAAEETLRASAPAVFRLHNAMCEPATHCSWARIVCARAELYGVQETAPRLWIRPAEA